MPVGDASEETPNPPAPCRPPPHPPQVRLAFLHTVGDWMLRLRERLDHEQRLLPYLLSALSDEAAEVQVCWRHSLHGLACQRGLAGAGSSPCRLRGREWKMRVTRVPLSEALQPLRPCALWHPS